ncbi:Glyoxalase/bleomycin resistance protein/dioxygenase [Salinarchaeum sp. Harcht-Bsk1]|uniref:VOC family protein n=1 Tax=Salinarchaeum sp. Harcht-Bsk1 TaxID=1333523 RepID=UPI0003424247|nr:VOC family protein [Salinarchaeum sp. Harcht-Bsk1]AGN01408.1 Glyoxalase/bleomycin resistance protein/dioxygenase [Salinarchaeum sp. Harcht-Bsk1]
MDSDALPAATGIGRVALRVADLADTTAFYVDVLGFERLDPAAVPDVVPAPEGDRAVLGAGGDALLVLEEAPDAPSRSPDEAGLYHVAIRVPNRPSLGAAIVRCRERDLLDGAADHGVSEAVYLRDPEGNGLELYADRPKAEWPLAPDGRVEMVTDPLDLDALVALAGDDPADAPLPAGTTIGHVHLEVTDLDATNDFYADALGTNLRQRMGEQALFLAAGDYHHHVGANTWRRRSAPASPDSPGLGWFEVVVPDDAALDAAADRLEASGVAVDRFGDGEATASGLVVASDPDGVVVRLRVDGAIAAPTGE